MANKKLPLYKHQEETKRLYQKSPLVFDASDPGTGKTRVALEAWAERRVNGGGCLLVIAPKTLLETAWAEDIDKFIPEFSYSVAYAQNRVKAFNTPADIYITNTDATKWLEKQPDSFFSKFDSVVVDESPYFKHRTSIRSKALIKISKHFKYRAALCGTPNANSITELWNQIRFLDNGKRLGRSFYHFRNATCMPEQVGPEPNMIRWVDKPNAEQAVNSLIKDITIRHDFAECDVPKNVPREIKFTLSPKHFGAYLEMEKTAILELEEADITAVNAAVLRNKLLQIASGAVYSQNGEYEVLDKKRYELVMDLIMERRHTVCFFNWRHQRDQLMELAKRKGLSYELIDGSVPDRQRKGIVQAFQHGYYRVLFMHYKSGAHGLTLTKATATIWPSPIYEADYFKQGIHRVHRTTQTEETENITIAAKGTVESKVYEKLYDKHGHMINFLDILKGNKDR